MTKIISVFILIILISAAVFAQEETVPAASSDLTGASLPAGAVRVVEGHVPAEISETLDKLVAMGKGKIAGGEREVLAWTENFKKSNGPALAKKLTSGLQAAGWAVETEAVDNEL